MVIVYDIILLCFMTHRLIVLYNCMSYNNSFQLAAWTRNSIANDQREIIPKNIQSRVMVLA